MHLGWLSADMQARWVYASCHLCIFFLVCSLVQGAAAFDGMVRTELFSIFKCQTSICESKNSVLCRKTWLKLYILFKAAFN